MKEKYTKPEVEVIDFESEDIICCSVGGWPGNGWGDTDNYHDHDHEHHDNRGGQGKDHKKWGDLP